MDGCGEAFHARGLCQFHYNRLRHGIPLDQPRIRARGEGSIADGYHLRYTKNDDGKTRAIRVHRVVMADVVGRPLYDFETVHHKNGIRSDNDADNLELWTTPQPRGQRPEDLVEWVLAVYPELVAAATAAHSGGPL